MANSAENDSRLVISVTPYIDFGLSYATLDAWPNIETDEIPTEKRTSWTAVLDATVDAASEFQVEIEEGQYADLKHLIRREGAFTHRVEDNQIPVCAVSTEKLQHETRNFVASLFSAASPWNYKMRQLAHRQEIGEFEDVLVRSEIHRAWMTVDEQEEHSNHRNTTRVKALYLSCTPLATSLSCPDRLAITIVPCVDLSKGVMGHEAVLGTSSLLFTPDKATTWLTAVQWVNKTLRNDELFGARNLHESNFEVGSIGNLQRVVKEWGEARRTQSIDLPIFEKSAGEQTLLLPHEDSILSAMLQPLQIGSDVRKQITEYQGRAEFGDIDFIFEDQRVYTKCDHVNDQGQPITSIAWLKPPSMSA